MNQNASVRIGVLFTALIVALAAIGVGSALWSETLTINGNVATGTLDVDYLDAWTEDNEVPEKDYAECVAITTGGDWPEARVQFDIYNGYPSYECWAYFVVENTGSIPVHMSQPRQVYLGTPEGEPTPDAVTIAVEECWPEEYQLHPDERALCMLHFHVEQPAEQDADYNFTYNFLAWQYNEAP